MREARSAGNILGVRTPATQRSRIATLPIAALTAMVLTLAVAGCAGAGKAGDAADRPDEGKPQAAARSTEEAAPMQVTSSAFEDKTLLPSEFAGKPAGGDDVSPPLSWSNTPQGTRTLAITVIDRHPVARDFVHWAVVGIPPTTTSLPRGASGALPAGRELVNSAGIPGWYGPTPPAGTGPHDYEFTVYALDVASLDLPRQPTAAQLSSAMEGHVIASDTITGTYGR